MTGLPLATDRPADRAGIGASALAFAAVALSSALTIAGATLALWASPLYFDGALDRAGSAAILGLPPDEIHELSHSVWAELLIGPGTFAQTVTGSDGAPVTFFGPAEAAHLRDVQLLLRLFIGAVTGAVAVLAAAVVRSGERRWIWRAVAHGAGGLAVGVAAAGIFFAFAFEPAFTLFHLLLFPGGNWSFDPGVARMVQLYPTQFWEETTTVYAGLAVALAVLTWAVARRRARRMDGLP